MHLNRAEGFLYTKHPVQRLTHGAVPTRASSDEGEMLGYAYTARRFPRPIFAAISNKARRLKLVYGYAYTARYDQIHDEQTHDDRIGRIAA